jgi:dUTP pyrophosphatase
LGLKFILPPGHYGRLAPRSGLALSGVDVVAGVIGTQGHARAHSACFPFISFAGHPPPRGTAVLSLCAADVDFKGEVVVILANTTDSVFKVKTGDRIAQLILEKCSTPAVILVEDVGDSARGEAGFGSTGLASC